MTDPSAAAAWAATDELLSTTRSVRKRFDFTRPVDPDVILECVALAQQAPSGGNTQGWRFVVVTAADLRRQLGDLYRAGAGDYLLAQKDKARDAQTRRVYESAVFLADNIDRVPVHVIPCIYGRPTDDLFTSAGLFGSILPATWSFMLALRSRGLGSVWTTLHLKHEAQAADLLGIPAKVTQIGLIPVGHYTGTTFRPVARRPAAEITYWDGWKRAD
jgi:nitroreductase